jgi:hypothetical protein
MCGSHWTLGGSEAPFSTWHGSPAVGTVQTQIGHSRCERADTTLEGQQMSALGDISPTRLTKKAAWEDMPASPGQEQEATRPPLTTVSLATSDALVH